MKKRILKKLKSTCGESLGETLASLIIIALGMTMLAASIVSASNVNKNIKDYDTSFKTASSSVSGTVTVTHKITLDDDSTPAPNSVAVSVYTTNEESGAGEEGADSEDTDSDAKKVHYIYYEPVKQSAAQAGNSTGD